MVQETPPLLLPITVAVSCRVWLGLSEPVDGLTEIATGVRLMVTVAVIAVFATLVACTVIVCVELMEDGAV
jgi:hypothetical protein